MNCRKLLAGVCVLLMCMLVERVGFCEEASNFDETEALIFILREKGVISNEEASRFLQIYQKTSQADREENSAIRREYDEKLNAYEEKYKQQDAYLDRKIDEFRAEMLYNQVPDWVSKMKWKGSIRSRYQADLFDKHNAELLKSDDFTELANTRRDRHRARIRARLDLLTNIGEGVQAGIRLSTGSEKDPVSTNDTMGDYFNKDGLTVDRAYLAWQPVPSLTLLGGRFANPWLSTDLVWDRDVNFEGLALSTQFFSVKDSHFFFTLGGFPLQEEEWHQDKWLFGYQLGRYFKPRADLSYQFAVAYYDFKNISGRRNSVDRPGEKDYSMPLFMQKGNSLMDIDPAEADILPALASDFNEVDVTARIDCAFFYPINVVVQLDFVTNVGFDQKDVAEKQGEDSVPEDTSGYQVSITVGHEKTKKLGQWQCYFAYKHLEADAMVDAFTDSDFHLGGTNAKGWVLGAQAGIAKNTWVAAKWISADEILGPPLAIDVVQLDLNVSF